MNPKASSGGTHSAPSSPTSSKKATLGLTMDNNNDAFRERASGSISMSPGHRPRSPNISTQQQRPMSVFMVAQDSSSGSKQPGGEVTYTRVTFGTDQSNRPVPIRRKGTKYSQILPQTCSTTSAVPAAATCPVNSTDQQQLHTNATVVAAVSSFPPSEAGAGNAILPDSETYDVPPPPVPVRTYSNQMSAAAAAHEDSSGSSSGSTVNRPATVQSKSPTTEDQARHAQVQKDPFAQDPFADDAEPWNDPEAFYDRPTNAWRENMPRVVSPLQQQQAQPIAASRGGESGREEEEELGGDSSDEKAESECDFTGSAYEDASQFLRRNHIPPRSEATADHQELQQRGNNNALSHLHPLAFDGDMYVNYKQLRDVKEDEAEYDLPPLPPPESDGVLPESLSSSLGGGYDYPAELLRHPQHTHSSGEERERGMPATSEVLSHGIGNTRGNVLPPPLPPENTKPPKDIHLTMPLPPLPTSATSASTARSGYRPTNETTAPSNVVMPTQPAVRPLQMPAASSGRSGTDHLNIARGGQHELSSSSSAVSSRFTVPTSPMHPQPPTNTSSPGPFPTAMGGGGGGGVGSSGYVHAAGGGSSDLGGGGVGGQLSDGSGEWGSFQSGFPTRGGNGGVGPGGEGGGGGGGGGLGGGGGGGGGGVGSSREELIMQLCGLGFSRSDVVRALAIASNDFSLAKMILKEFGHR